MGPVARKIDERLRAALAPAHLEIIDDSAGHRGHSGHNPEGESHFTVRIVAEAFTGQSRVARQRQVYAALGDLMDGRIHALSIDARAPSPLDLGASPAQNTPVPD